MREIPGESQRGVGTKDIAASAARIDVSSSGYITRNKDARLSIRVMSFDLVRTAFLAKDRIDRFKQI